MLVFTTSGKGGTGRTVTGANLAHQCALQGDDVVFVDFDFGSPTTAVFDVPAAVHGAEGNGLHSYLTGHTAQPARIDVWEESEHPALRARPSGSGRLVLLPGDAGGGDFATGPETVRHCVDLLLRLNTEFDVIFIDLSAGRSYALDLAIEATARPETRGLEARWLVFHRWTRQHVLAACDLVFGTYGILAAGIERGHREDDLRGAVRFVRAAVPEPDAGWAGLTPARAAWSHSCDEALRRLAHQRGAGDGVVLGAVPFDPLLQWREQLITEEDVFDRHVANKETLAAFEEIARRLTDGAHRERP